MLSEYLWVGECGDFIFFLFISFAFFKFSKWMHINFNNNSKKIMYKAQGPLTQGSILYQRNKDEALLTIVIKSWMEKRRVYTYLLQKWLKVFRETFVSGNTNGNRFIVAFQECFLGHRYFWAMLQYQIGKNNETLINLYLIVCSQVPS